MQNKLLRDIIRTEIWQVTWSEVQEITDKVTRRTVWNTTNDDGQDATWWATEEEIWRVVKNA